MVPNKTWQVGGHNKVDAISVTHSCLVDEANRLHATMHPPEVADRLQKCNERISSAVWWVSARVVNHVPVSYRHP